MQVILLQDVKSLGKKGEIVKVSDGYARNYVLPKKLGVEATEKNKNELRLQKAHEDKMAAKKLADAKAMAEDLAARKIVVKMKAGENGKVFEGERGGGQRSARIGPGQEEDPGGGADQSLRHF